MAIFKAPGSLKVTPGDSIYRYDQ